MYSVDFLAKYVLQIYTKFPVFWMPLKCMLHQYSHATELCCHWTHPQLWYKSSPGSLSSSVTGPAFSDNLLPCVDLG